MKYETPFKEAIDKSPVPTRGTSGGKYDAMTIPNTPTRDGGMLPELTFDTHFGQPKLSGPIKKTPFSDAQD